MCVKPRALFAGRLSRLGKVKNEGYVQPTRRATKRNIFYLQNHQTHRKPNHEDILLGHWVKCGGLGAGATLWVLDLFKSFGNSWAAGSSGCTRRVERSAGL